MAGYPAIAKLQPRVSERTEGYWRSIFTVVVVPRADAS